AAGTGDGLLTADDRHVVRAGQELARLEGLDVVGLGHLAEPLGHCRRALDLAGVGGGAVAVKLPTDVRRHELQQAGDVAAAEAGVTLLDEFERVHGASSRLSTRYSLGGRYAMAGEEAGFRPSIAARLGEAEALVALGRDLVRLPGKAVHAAHIGDENARTVFVD